MAAPSDVIILGAGGFAREVWWALDEAHRNGGQWKPVGYIDENPKSWGNALCGIPILGGFEQLAQISPRPDAICGVGKNALRRKFVDLTTKVGLRFATAIHPHARMSRYVEIGEGSVVCAGTTLTTQITIGRHVNLNLHCTIGHDAIIEDFCNINPGVHVSGNVHIESGVDMGTGAVVLPGIHIGHDSVIGAGAVVREDVPSLSVAVGVPAKVIKTLPPPTQP